MSGRNRTRRCSAIVVLHDSGAEVGACLHSLPIGVETVVVDNASKDDGVQVARNARPDATILQTENRGFGAGCNIGARDASGELLLFLNPDCVLEEGAVDVLTERLASVPGGIVGPALLTMEGDLREVCRRRSRPVQDMASLLPVVWKRPPAAARRDLPASHPVYEHGGPVDYLQGACMLVRREDFIAAGGFDEDFFLFSEEEELCDRLRARGGECIYEPRAHVRHAWGASTARVEHGAVYHYYRSRAIYYRKRVGDARGRLRVLAIAAAAGTQLPLQALAAVTRRDFAMRRRWTQLALRGLLDGSRVPLASGPAGPFGRVGDAADGPVVTRTAA
jgi:GT2 family glycosyltransferase